MAETEGFYVDRAFRSFPAPVQAYWRNVAFDRLNHALATADPLPIDADSRIVFISDCHRGDGSNVDLFAYNKSIYHGALNHYFDGGFTYIEVGDGDELWDNAGFADVLSAHGDTFKLLHSFNDVGRLYILIGNHDTFSAHNYQKVKDGLPTYHSLLLTERPSGQQLLVTHGHQADFTSSRFYPVSRLLSRTVLRWLQWPDRELLPPASTGPTADTDPWKSRRRFDPQGKRIEQRLLEWIDVHNMPIICGHTHLPAFPAPNTTPYFNLGSCVMPGFLTALELQRGELTMVKWTLDSDGNAARLGITPSFALFALASS